MNTKELFDAHIQGDFETGDVIHGSVDITDHVFSLMSKDQ